MKMREYARKKGDKSKEGTSCMIRKIGSTLYMHVYKKAKKKTKIKWHKEKENGEKNYAYARLISESYSRYNCCIYKDNDNNNNKITTKIMFLVFAIFPLLLSYSKSPIFPFSLSFFHLSLPFYLSPVSLSCLYSLSPRVICQMPY